ncbi:hypothetical protein CHLNCDRAFT_37484 [Chlorella variabilis]|uniref:Lumazine-binding domain-containing protein n=1 Tax=Chlorella variabilis TaxID=554065 RepID=E1ZSB9_CHLVA|nr:hypothetical protein CHLNCDRAFT_37484 [Chlorella variabilis]EFN51278.1 hypothetical protein CHLNCDRAFT_37484 [Chlorella variabilis]|eukprot:XP_005843380.1 hypothetical protein CHLNCDRAFT_37484 [Chlorella variabilis]
MHISAAALRPRAPQLQAARQRSSRGRSRRVLSVQSLFTGIVQGKGTVRAVDRKTDFCVFDIELPAERTDNVQIGASVAINGTCLTVVAQQGATLRFDVMVETLRRTNLGALQPGTQINFERSARVGDEIGGHTVSGHVHTTATIVDVQDTENNRRVEYEVSDPAFMKYILPKGFISVDGCSLTVGEVTDTTFSVYLIPETMRVTVAGVKGQGDVVNIEVEAQTQAIVDTVERVLQRYLEGGRLTQAQAAAR